MSEPRPVPTVRELLRARNVPLATFQIALGVVLLPACGAGALIMTVGSAWLLEQLAERAGAPRGIRVSAGVFSVALAMLLGGVVVGAAALAERWPLVAVTPLAGAALSPLVFVPIAAAREKRPWTGGVVRAVDAAGADFGRLAPLSAIVATALLAPVMLAVRGAAALLREPSTAWALATAGAVLFWALAVPVSAAVLTARYARLTRRLDTGTHLAPLRPVLTAAGIGVVCLLVAVGAVTAKPRHFAPTHRRGPLPGEPVEITRERFGAQQARTPLAPVTVAEADELAPPRGVDACASEATAPDRLTLRCDGEDRRFEARVGPDGAIPLDPVTKLRLAATPPVLAALGLALLSLCLALLRVGHVRAKLRLLRRWTHALEGWVEPDDDGARLRFEASDGERRVRVPLERLTSAGLSGVEARQPARLLSSAPLGVMGYRDADAPCPADALLVVGDPERVLAHHLTRARKVGFRLAVVALGALVTASALLLHAS